MADGPLLVFGPRSLTYDFGPDHPLTPRRFGPGIELLRWVGATPAFDPEPASDDELALLHAADYLSAVRRLGRDPHGSPAAGIGPGDDPPFEGMHDAAAAVVGGSLRALDAILDGRAEHAFHPGGGLHHAMRDRASGFCIYNDPALAIARARTRGRRVLYLDFDVHHGDGVQALLADDPGVLTVSLHETGRTLFPGTGAVSEIGRGAAAGTSVNVPLEPLTGPEAWLAAVEGIVPQVAAAFGPDLIVSQHGSDSHAWDPLAHLLVTTTAMGAAARLVDRLSHRYAGGAWLATGGGGYSAYRVVPRTWTFVWLAGAHKSAPHHIPERWRHRWEDEAAGFEGAALPLYFDDEPGMQAMSTGREAASVRDAHTVRLARAIAVPAILRAAEERGWWRPVGAFRRLGPGGQPLPDDPPVADDRDGRLPRHASEPIAPTAISVLAPLTADQVDRLSLAPRTIAPADAAEARALLRAALEDGAAAVGAVAGAQLVGVAVSAAAAELPPSGLPVPPELQGRLDVLVALGVAPGARGAGLGTRLLRTLVDQPDRAGRLMLALSTVAERDAFEPAPIDARRAAAGRLFAQAGFVPLRLPPVLEAVDPGALLAVHAGPGVEAQLVDVLERALGR